MVARFILTAPEMEEVVDTIISMKPSSYYSATIPATFWNEHAEALGPIVNAIIAKSLSEGAELK